MNFVIHRNELSHHGILGQKWGKKNGPPYPLDYQDHSAKEKRLMTKTQKEKSRDEKPSKSGLDIDKKRLMKQAAIAAGLALAVAGGYALYESGALDKLVKSGKNFVGNVDLGDEIPRSNVSHVEIPKTKAGDFASRLKTTVADSSKAGLNPDKIDKVMLSSINAANEDKRDNCPSTSLSYILNRLFGGDFTALNASELGGKDPGDIRTLFKPGTIKRIDAADIDRECSIFGVKFDQRVIDAIPNGSTGIIAFRKSNGAGHVANYEKDINGVFAVVEPQHNRIFRALTALLNVSANENGYEFVQEIMDFSHAELVDGAASKLPKWVR